MIEKNYDFAYVGCTFSDVVWATDPWNECSA